MMPSPATAAREAQSTGPDAPIVRPDSMWSGAFWREAAGLPPWVVLVLIVGFLLMWFYVLGARTLVPTDEGRYAEMAREMVATHDWITTRLNGIKYFEKPPLQTWMNALTFTLFGLGEWQARLWTGLCGLLGIGLVFHTGRRVWNPATGWTAALVLASSFFWAAMGHINTLDMGLSGMMTLSLAALLLAQRADATPREQRNWMLVCWAGMALAVLSKGLIGIVLPGAVLVLYTLWTRQWGLWKRLHLVSGLAVFFLISAPWFIAVSIRNPEFPYFFFVHEHFQRFTSKVHHRYGPPYYFIPILVLGIFPWLGILLQSLWRGMRASPALSASSAGIAPHQTVKHSSFAPDRLLFVWAVFIFTFFSISDSKLPSYILPIFPALALLIARLLQEASDSALRASAGLTVLFTAIGIPFTPLIPRLAKDAYSLPLFTSYVPWVAAAATVSLIASALAFWLARRQPMWSVALLAAGAFTTGQLLLLGHEPLGRYASGAAHVPAIEAELTPQTPLYAVGLYEQALPFYLRRTTTLVDHADELEFGLKQQPELWIPTREQFVKKWIADHDAGRKAVAIMSEEDYRALRQAKVPMRVIAKDPRRVVVTNAVESAIAHDRKAGA